jgi:hypothetical protein
MVLAANLTREEPSTRNHIPQPLLDFSVPFQLEYEYRTIRIPSCERCWQPGRSEWHHQRSTTHYAVWQGWFAHSLTDQFSLLSFIALSKYRNQ